MGRKKNPDNNYFNQAVEDAVCTYIHADDQQTKERAFRVVYPAFCKIAEVMCNKMKMSYFDTTKEDLIADAVTFMVEKMSMFNCGTGTKAFSYFTVVCKNKLILDNNKNHQHMKRYSAMSEFEDGFDVFDESINRTELQKEAESLINGFTKYLELHFDKIFTTPNKSDVGEILIQNLKNWESIPEINRRKIHASIFNATDVGGRANFTKIMNMVTVHYNQFKRRWSLGNTSLEWIEKITLSDEEVQTLKSKYISYNKKWGMVAFAKRFGVEEWVIREYVNDFI
jgi:hypothetical protein